MNIFVIDLDPRTAARHLVDKHISKMVTETAQILSNCFTLDRMAMSDCPRNQKGEARKHSYPHHPCCKWAPQSRDNMRWLVEHAREMDIERMWRFGKVETHFSMSFINWASQNLSSSIAPESGLTEFAQAMPEEYKSDNAVDAYRSYYALGKTHLHKWTRNKPSWIEEIINGY